MSVIVYKSNAGYTAEYARLLGEELKLTVYSLDDAVSKLPRDTDVIYLGWVMAGSIKGYKAAAKRFSVKAVCGVGMMGTGEKTEDMRKATCIPEDIPVFSLQGGFDITKLHGFYKLVMKLMSKALCTEVAKKESPTNTDLEMAEVLQHGGSYVCRENLADVVNWYGGK